MNEQSEPASNLGDILRELQGRLLPGGPLVDPRLLEDCLADRLPAEDRARVEQNISTYKAWDRAWVDLQIAAAQRDPIAAISSVDLDDEEEPDPPPAVSPAPPPAADRTGLWSYLAQAACILIAIGAGGWACFELARNRAAFQSIASLQGEVYRSRMELAMVYKEECQDASNSPVRSYWSMTTSPEVLSSPGPKGGTELPKEAAEAADRARRILTELAQAPYASHEALLELASLEIAAGRLDAAEQDLAAAKAAAGGAPK